jgi:hypothetical protein
MIALLPIAPGLPYHSVMPALLLLFGALAAAGAARNVHGANAAAALETPYAQ